MSWLFRTLEKFAFPAMNAPIPMLSPAEIQQTCNMQIGPIYHGTKNGYDCNLAKTDRIAATKQMTDVLSSRCDAILFKGKTIYKALDGNQICVYNPNILRRVDKSLAQSGDIGSKVRRKSDGMLGTLLDRRSLSPEHQHYHGNETELLRVKWRKGGTDFNVRPGDIDFL